MPTKVPDFANIRMIAGRQVLAYKEETDEAQLLIVHKTSTGSSVTMKMGYDTLNGLNKAFADFCAGKVDAELKRHIKKVDRDFVAEPIQ